MDYILQAKGILSQLIFPVLLTKLAKATCNKKIYTVGKLFWRHTDVATSHYWWCNSQPIQTKDSMDEQCKQQVIAEMLLFPIDCLAMSACPLRKSYVLLLLNELVAKLIT